MRASHRKDHASVVELMPVQNDALSDRLNHRGKKILRLFDSDRLDVYCAVVNVRCGSAVDQETQ